MLDRIPTPGQEGRVLVTPENGGAPFYARIQMADNPTQNGDPFAKFTMLHDAVAAAYDKDDKAVPNDIFEVLSRFHKGLGNEYVWEKIAEESTDAYITSEVVTGNQYVATTSGITFNYEVADSISVRDDGEITLENPVSFSVAYNSLEDYGPLIGKYFKVVSDGTGAIAGGSIYPNTVYFCPSSTTFSLSYLPNGGYGIKASQSFTKYTGHKKVTTGEFIGYVNSPDPNAYPIDDGYTYTALGQLGNKVQIAVGSYKGTGAMGASSPNTLTFNFTPKVVFLFAEQTEYLGRNGYNNHYAPIPSVYVWGTKSLALWNEAGIKWTDNYDQNTETSDYSKDQNYMTGCIASVDGNTMSWYATSGTQYNKADYTNSMGDRYVYDYYYLAIG